MDDVDEKDIKKARRSMKRREKAEREKEKRAGGEVRFSIEEVRRRETGSEEDEAEDGL